MYILSFDIYFSWTVNFLCVFMWLDMIMYLQTQLKQAYHELSFSSLWLSWLWLYIFALREPEKEKMAFIQR